MKIKVNKFQYSIRKLLVLSLLLLFVNSSFNLKIQNNSFVTATIQEDAYETIITAYETIAAASQKGLDVESYVEQLNNALEDYNSGEYINAYNQALQIIEDVDNALTNFRRNKILTYVIIPFNLLIVAALIFFLGMKMIKWHKRLSDEEFLDLEIVYQETENNTKI